MGTSLNGLTPAGTYPGLIKTGDNAPIDGTLKTLSDGNGNNLPMEASTTAVNFTGTLTQAGATLQPTLVSGTNIKTINGTSLLGSGNIPVVTSPSGVAGAIQFSNGSAFASDAANLFWDDANNRLGVGTNAPSARLTAQTTSAADGIVLQDASNPLALIGKWFDSSGFFDLSQNGTPYTRIQASQSYINTPITFGSASALSAMVGIKGSGTTSGTTSLLVQNSSGSELFKVADDGRVYFSTVMISGLNTVDRGGGLRINYAPTSDPINFYTGGGYNRLSITNDGNIGAGTISPNASALLDLTSTTQGFLPPRMTTTQRDLISSVATGLVLYNTTTNKLQCYNGSTWNDLF